MSMNYTIRVHLPDKQKMYVADDNYGDAVLEELYKQHGDLKIEWCEKQFGETLDKAITKWKGKISTYFD